MHLAASKAGRVKPAFTTASDSARGTSIDASENHAMPPAMTSFPPYLSAIVPPKSWVAMYPHRKADWMMPCGTVR